MESESIDKTLQYAALNLIDERGYKGEAQNLDHQILIRILSVALLGAIRNQKGYEEELNPYRQTQSLLMSGDGAMKRRRVRKYMRYIKKRYSDVIEAVKEGSDLPRDVNDVVELTPN